MTKATLISDVIPVPDIRGALPRRRTRTREALLSAARQLMAERPRDAFTVDEVTQVAGVAKGSFYNHFPDKDALADEVYSVIHTKEEAEVGDVNRGVDDPVVRICRGMAVYARLALTTPQEARLLALSRIDGRKLASFSKGLIRDLRAALHTGRIVVPSIEAGASLVVGQVAMLMVRMRDLPGSAGPVVLVQHGLAVTLVGLGVEHREAHLLATQAADAIIADALSSEPAVDGASSP
jgi:AcrR family transcriptional regulator